LLNSGDRIPVTSMFTRRYLDNVEFDWTLEDLERVISSAAAGKQKGKQASSSSSSSREKSGSKLDPEDLIQSLLSALEAEAVEFSFPFLGLHQKCWRLFTQLREHCDPRLPPKSMLSLSELGDSANPWVVPFYSRGGCWAYGGVQSDRLGP